MTWAQSTKIRERLADVDYEVAKLQNKITSLQENIKQRQKDKIFCTDNKLPWALVAQLGLEQAELQIHIYEAEIAKFINEIKFLRLELQEIQEKNITQ